MPSLNVKSPSISAELITEYPFKSLLHSPGWVSCSESRKAALKDRRPREEQAGSSSSALQELLLEALASAT